MRQLHKYKGEPSDWINIPYCAAPLGERMYRIFTYIVSMRVYVYMYVDIDGGL